MTMAAESPLLRKRCAENAIRRRWSAGMSRAIESIKRPRQYLLGKIGKSGCAQAALYAAQLRLGVAD
jgi:hypothetical protein